MCVGKVGGIGKCVGLGVDMWLKRRVGAKLGALFVRSFSSEVTSELCGASGVFAWLWSPQAAVETPDLIGREAHVKTRQSKASEELGE